MAQATLLPDNRTAFEEAADLTGARASTLRDGLRDLVKPFDIPSPHLPWLSCSSSTARRISV